MPTPLPNPKYPIQTIDTNDPICLDDLKTYLANNGTTLLIRSENGHPNRGGYYFQIENLVTGSIRFFTFDQRDHFDLPPAEAVDFINHCSGLLFSEDMLRYCQNTIDLRND